ncbi:MAG: type II toxin-antitoxin system prevent-host-death family antitoxin, partial [Treponema sp.]|nr:type II toxin-antitoxin system prevent-host-death family antitoxin [Treponema sp.]
MRARTEVPYKIWKREKSFLTSCQKDGIFIVMKAMAVGELKTHFSEILEEVSHGKTIGITYGRAKKPVAMIVPYHDEEKAERKIGILDGKVT